MPSVGGDLPEAVGPVIAAPGENFCRSLSQVNLDAVAIELDLMNPARAQWHPVNRGGQCRFDEAGVRCLDAPGWPLWPRARHGSDEPQGQLPVPTGMARNEVAQMIRDLCAFDIAAGLDFSRDLVRDIIRPMLKRIEGDNAHRVVELTRQKIGDDGFDISPLDFRFAVNTAEPLKAVDYEVDRLIRPIGHG